MMRHALVLIMLSIGAGGLEAQSYSEKDFLTRTRRLTFDGVRAGEGYFAPDGTRLAVGGRRGEILLLDATTGETARRIDAQDDVPRVDVIRHDVYSTASERCSKY